MLLDPRARDVVAELGRARCNPTAVPAHAGCPQPSRRVHTQMGSINAPSPEEIEFEPESLDGGLAGTRCWPGLCFHYYSM